MTGLARLAARFAQLKAENRAGLVAYVMAADPDVETSLEILRELPAAGADVIELGFPFTDPMADGPSIQKAALRSLAAGGSLAVALDLVRRFREQDGSTPIVLMGYANPIESMGYAPFAQAAARAGADGALIVDIPPEEDAPLAEALAGQSLARIRLAAPTTSDDRLAAILAGASGFLYYVAVAGVTGAKAAETDAAAEAVARIRRRTDLPVAVGFGVRTPETAAATAKASDAVVVGSAFVDAVAEAIALGAPSQAARSVAERVAALAQAVRSARKREGATA